MNPKNLFSDIPTSIPDELFTDLLHAPAFRVERIASRGHHSPAGFWYDQEHAEWILLLSGRAVLEFADETEMTELKPGDYLNIPAHRRHRVHWTEPDSDTVWLAIHY
ncbi:MAG: cupin domain-containing protein [Syntrophales bacterium]|nr:cupin domain-containing protein [Syntrophales bacterium]